MLSKNGTTESEHPRFYGWHLTAAALVVLFLLVNLLTLSSPIISIDGKNTSIEDLANKLPSLQLFVVMMMKNIVFWIDIVVALFLFLELIQLIPWNRFVAIPFTLATIGAFGICLVLFLLVALFSAIPSVSLKFSGWLWLLASLGAAVFSVIMLISLLKHNPKKIKPISDMEFLAQPKMDKKNYKVGTAFAGIPTALWNGIKKLGIGIKNLVFGIGRWFKDIVMTFIRGDWKTKISYFVMGFGSIARGQVLRGVLFLLFEVVFIFYMVTTGGYWLGKLPSLGTMEPHYEAVPNRFGTGTVQQLVPGDNSFKIMLYGVLTLFFIAAFIYTWYSNVKQNKIAEEIQRTGKPLKSGRDDLRSLVDDNFHRTLLALPLTGILLFTVMPIFFMILVAFTNFDFEHDGVTRLFQWTGLAGFREMLTWSSGGVNYSAAFGEILTWTLIWAFFATFTNYFLGIFVAMMINKKGIKFKKVWRTVLILTIAIPQFISLLFVSQMFAKNGIVNGMLMDLGFIKYGQEIGFWEDPALARVMVIVINIWIGIPYLMLIATGILMNIPADLYESAKIDGASGWKQFAKITLPYMLFITGPYLLTSFTGNMNNFNVIYLLTGGGPTNTQLSGAANVGHTDLLITWLFKLTTGANQKYYLASVVGILVFLVVAVISLVVYGLLPSVKNEEDFQ